MVTFHHTLRLARATLFTVAMISVITFGGGEPEPAPTYQPFCTVEGTVNQTVDRVRWKGSLWWGVQLEADTVTQQERELPRGATEGECRISEGETAQVYLATADIEAGDQVRGVAHYEETGLVKGVFVRNVTRIR